MKVVFIDFYFIHMETSCYETVIVPPDIPWRPHQISCVRTGILIQPNKKLYMYFLVSWDPVYVVQWFAVIRKP